MAVVTDCVSECIFVLVLSCNIACLCVYLYEKYYVLHCSPPYYSVLWCLCCRKNKCKSLQKCAHKYTLTFCFPFDVTEFPAFVFFGTIHILWSIFMRCCLYICCCICRVSFIFVGHTMSFCFNVFFFFLFPQFLCCLLYFCLRFVITFYILCCCCCCYLLENMIPTFI